MLGGQAPVLGQAWVVTRPGQLIDDRRCFYNKVHVTEKMHVKRREKGGPKSVP